MPTFKTIRPNYNVYENKQCKYINDIPEGKSLPAFESNIVRYNRFETSKLPLKVTAL